MLQAFAGVALALVLMVPLASAGHHDCGEWPDQVVLQAAWSSEGCFRAGQGGEDEGFCSAWYSAIGVGPVTYESSAMCVNRVVIDPAAAVGPEAEGFLPTLAGMFTSSLTDVASRELATKLGIARTVADGAMHAACLVVSGKAPADLCA